MSITNGAVEAAVDVSYLPCGHMCMRASDVGVYVAGDPVAYAHPGCPVHGHCEKYVASDTLHECGLRPCANCKGYEDEHDYRSQTHGDD